MRSTVPPGCVLAFDDEHDMADALARALGVPLALVERHRFPDGELKLRLPATLPPAASTMTSQAAPAITFLLQFAPMASWVCAGMLSPPSPWRQTARSVSP